MQITDLNHLPTVISDMQFGFFFEEGGCFGMACALDTWAQKHGFPVELYLQHDFVHAFARIGDITCDHTGTHNDLRGTKISRPLLVATAIQRYGHTIESIEIAYANALAVLEELDLRYSQPALDNTHDL